MPVNESLRAYLEEDFTIPVRDPVWRHIYLSPALAAITATSEFQQLTRIRQLGPSYLVYPGATHTRFNHSLGVFYIARRILHKISGDPLCPPISVEAGKAFLCAALLHDLGHFPYTHSLKELPLMEHEQLTARLLLGPGISSLIRNELGTDPELVAQIVDVERPASHELTGLFRNMLSGPLDPDKLDYLTRDAYFCGVPYGTQDIDFILSRIRTAGDKGLALEESGISALEHLLFSKYLMYRSVYWHRGVRIATGMIKKALHLGLAEGVLAPEDLYGLDDDSFYEHISRKRHFEPFHLVDDVHNGQIFALVAQTAFDEGNRAHKALCDLATRSSAEAALRDRIADAAGVEVRPHELIVDIPEAVSFEVHMPVLRGDGQFVDYPQSRTVFTAGVVKDFTRTLRVIRLAVPERVGRALASKINLDKEIQQLAQGGVLGYSFSE